RRDGRLWRPRPERAVPDRGRVPDLSRQSTRAADRRGQHARDRSQGRSRKAGGGRFGRGDGFDAGDGRDAPHGKPWRGEGGRARTVRITLWPGDERRLDRGAQTVRGGHGRRVRDLSGEYEFG